MLLRKVFDKHLKVFIKFVFEDLYDPFCQLNSHDFLCMSLQVFPHCLFYTMSFTRIFSFFEGKYTRLKATFRFERRMGFYLIQVYLPSIIITMLSWLSFYIDPRDIGDRVSLGKLRVSTYQ